MGTIMKLYNYFDYEEAYYHLRYTDCKKIGLYLLSQLQDKKSKELYKKLEKFEYDWIKENNNSTILQEVKVWLMVNCNYL